jgi:hypothetical protein
MTFFTQMSRFLSFEAVDVRTVAITAFISYLLQINAIISGEPIYLIALYTLLPWIPIALYEGVWKVQNYAAVAFLGLFTILQIGHFAEHLIQVFQIDLMNGTVACPPPTDNLQNFGRAVANGLRESGLEPTFYSVETIIKPGPDGLPIIGSDGMPLSGAAACAVFGQLDLEIVHLIWELIGLFGTAACLYFFHKNIFLWIAFAALCWHALEHLTITYFYYFEQEKLWEGFKQLWATYPITGNSFVAEPVGKEAAMLNFYEAGGKFGLMARHGMFEQLTGFEGMPGRAHLHMGYNLTITVPTVIGFLCELRTIKNRYLELVFDKLSNQELSRLSLNVKTKSFKAGEDVVKQGEIATFCYVITKGSAEVLIDKGTRNESLIATLGEGDLFGEIGLLDKNAKKRTATVTAVKSLSCLEIDAATFADLTDSKTGDYRSEGTSSNIKKLVATRLSQLNEG